MRKKALWQHCWAQGEERAQRLQKQMDALQEALTSETKSSAGDKHETGRAMVQLEQEKLSQQLLELEKAKQTLQRINIGTNTTKIGMGSLVKTSAAHYFIAIYTGREHGLLYFGGLTRCTIAYGEGKWRKVCF